MKNRRGQVTIFVIIAIVLVVAFASFYFYRDIVKDVDIPLNIEPIKTNFMSCLELNVRSGVDILGGTGGYINLPEFEPGSRYQPTSSQLTFNGVEIPYWFYMNGANIEKRRVPTIEFMEAELESFVEEKIVDCYFDNFRDEGFVIEIGNPDASVKISNDFVDVDLDMDFSVQRDFESFALSSHELRIDSNLGYLFEEALNVYNKQEEEYFLEDYAIDVLRLNLPVDGVELGCSPLVWDAGVLNGQLKDALQDNIMMITNEGDSDDYFVVDLPENVDTRFFYSSDWPTYFEVNPTDDSLMIANPVGNQNGLGVLGFCYVPYHYVYNVRFPVLVRLTKDQDVFQFPVNVLIEGNVPREPLVREYTSSQDVQLCEYANTEIFVNVFDSEGDFVDGDVFFECFGSRCKIGETDNGVLEGLFPQCANALIEVDADGYKKTNVVYSTIERGSVSIFVDSEYERNVALFFGGEVYDDRAVVVFSSGDYTKTVVLPDQSVITLAPGEYDVSVYAYSGASINIPETEQEVCVDVPARGVVGLFGIKKKECVTNVVPEQILSDALVGGGSSEIFIGDEDLRYSDDILIYGEELIIPKTLEELQNNYILVEASSLGVEFK
jgi:hypothetical protein